MTSVCLLEAMGTATLLYAINMSAGPFQPFAIGLTIAAAIHQTGNITGGHFNPAVTIAVLIREGKLSNIGFAIIIMVSQIIGAVIGCAVFYLSTARSGIETLDGVVNTGFLAN